MPIISAAQAAGSSGGSDGYALAGIVGGNMAWPLVIVGILMGLALVMVEVKSPMLFSVGMYLPVETTFAIFIGGLIRWVTDMIRDRRNLNPAQKARVENAGVLTASGLIAGEALCGLLIAAIYRGTPEPIFEAPHWIGMVIAAVFLVAVMVMVPLRNAGRPTSRRRRLRSCSCIGLHPSCLACASKAWAPELVCQGSGAAVGFTTAAMFWMISKRSRHRAS